jgi:hypothetical protein
VFSPVFSQARNDGLAVQSKSSGIALLVMLAFILVAFTTIAISRLSGNSGELKSRAKTTQALVQSRDAIMAFTLAPANPANPPGILPCPDTDGDGISNPIPPSAAACTNRRGLVPFVTLGIAQPFDGNGAPIWYVVATQYSGTVATPHNSSSASASTLRLNTIPEAFIVLAPNIPFAGQVRPGLLPYRNPLFNTVTQYLELENANSILDDIYTDLQNPTQNDQVLAMTVGDFWTSVEGRVLREVGALLRDYRASCNAYPWPAPYASFGTNNSDTAPLAIRVYEGRVPLGTASPNVWGAPCAPTLPAGWILTHWGDSLYYAICRQAAPANPPTASCLQLGGLIVAEAILIAPGIPFPLTQDRLTPTVVISDYFENQNASVVDNVFTQLKPSSHTVNFNDLIYVVR